MRAGAVIDLNNRGCYAERTASGKSETKRVKLFMLVYLHFNYGAV